MKFAETFKLYSSLDKKLDNYAAINGVSESYIGAKNTLSDLIQKSQYDENICFKFNKWLKSRHTLDLKEIVKSNNLYDFNVMCYLDTVSYK